MWSISCNIQHLTQQQSQLKIQWSMLRKKNLSPFLAGKYCIWTKLSTQRCHQANEGKSGLRAEWVRASGALCSIWSKKNLSAERRQETHCLSSQEKEKGIKHYVDRETTVARQSVFNAETAIMKEQDDMRTVEKEGSTSRKRVKTFHEMFYAIVDSLSELASPDDEDDGENEADLNKMHRWAAWAKMMNPPEWWAESPKWFSNTCIDFGWRRWGMTNWCNQDGGRQPTTSVRVIWSMGRLNGGFRPLSTPKQTWRQPHHHSQHLESLCRLCVSSQDNPKFRKGLLDWEVFKWCWVASNTSHTNAQRLSSLTQRLMCHWTGIRSLLNPYAFILA